MSATQSTSAAKPITVPAVSYGRHSPRPEFRIADRIAQDKDCDSIPIQLDRNRRYAEMAGLTIVHEISDPDQTADSELHERKGGRELVHVLKTYNIDHVIFQRIDRFSRNTIFGLGQMSEWDRQGVVVHFSDQGGNTINTRTETGKFIFTLLLSEAAFARGLSAERTSHAMIEYQKRGRMFGHTPPYGKRRKKDNDRELEDDPMEAFVRDKIVKWHMQGYKPGEIAHWLTGGGYRTRNNSPWYSAAVQRVIASWKKWNNISTKTPNNRTRRPVPIGGIILDQGDAGFEPSNGEAPG